MLYLDLYIYVLYCNDVLKDLTMDVVRNNYLHECAALVLLCLVNIFMYFNNNCIKNRNVTRVLAQQCVSGSNTIRLN